MVVKGDEGEEGDIEGGKKEGTRARERDSAKTESRQLDRWVLYRLTKLN